MKKYMYEIRCANSGQDADFGTMFCNVHWLVKKDDIEEETSRRCWNCNSNEWHSRRTFLTEKEYFKKMLEDPDGTIGYHLADFERQIYVEDVTEAHKPWNTE